MLSYRVALVPSVVLAAFIACGGDVVDEVPRVGPSGPSGGGGTGATSSGGAGSTIDCVDAKWKLSRSQEPHFGGYGGLGGMGGIGGMGSYPIPGEVVLSDAEFGVVIDGLGKQLVDFVDEENVQYYRNDHLFWDRGEGLVRLDPAYCSGYVPESDEVQCELEHIEFLESGALLVITSHLLWSVDYEIDISTGGDFEELGVAYQAYFLQVRGFWLLPDERWILALGPEQEGWPHAQPTPTDSLEIFLGDPYDHGVLLDAPYGDEATSVEAGLLDDGRFALHVEATGGDSWYELVGSEWNAFSPCPDE